jgi:transcriptional regulator with XRE-family HTH domain
MPVIIGELVKAGRALARLSQAELASHSGVSIHTLRRIEYRGGGPVVVYSTTAQAIVETFARRGVKLDFEDGVIALDIAKFKELHDYT